MTDIPTARLVSAIVGVLSLVGLIFAGLLALRGDEYAAFLGFASTAVALLIPSPLSKARTAEPTEVTVANPPDAPALVAEVPAPAKAPARRRTPRGD